MGTFNYGNDIKLDVTWLREEIQYASRDLFFNSADMSTSTVEHIEKYIEVCKIELSELVG